MKVITSVLLLLCLVIKISARHKIVNGETAADGQFPYQVALKYYTRFLCGGSVINERWILTAAHCLLNRSPKNMEVYVGSNQLTDVKAQIYEVEYLTYHKNFSMKHLKNDIGLLRVSKDIDLNDKVQPIALSSNDVSESDAPAVFTGWGQLNTTTGAVPKDLQKIDLKIISHKDCEQFWKNIMPVDESQICTFTKKGEGSCMGDSGGPLVSGDAQVGIVSYGKPCAVGFPDVFTKVYYFIDWIQEQQNKFPK